MSAPSLHPLQGVPSEVKPSGRTELPAVSIYLSHFLSVRFIYFTKFPAVNVNVMQDLFTATYQSYHAAAPGWQAGPPHGMHYGMPYGLQQYNNTMVKVFLKISNSIKNLRVSDIAFS